MILDTGSIVRKRYRMRRNIRFAALALFMVFLIGTSAPLMDLLITGRVFDGMRLLEILRQVASVPGNFLVGAAFLCVMQRRLVVWLLPLPENLCPQCGYHLRELTTTRCPECGLELAAELLGGPEKSGVGDSGAAA
ncbi:MAG: hypothetical protein KF745_09055 [Phycisphaeraceae bacterium]|nr:hypothetical protein [Phycisphaeraceae bacterium]